MIRINLLPPDRRRAERTPFSHYMLNLLAAVLLIIVVIVLGAQVYWYLNLSGEVDDYNKKITLIKVELDKAKYDQKQAEIDKVKAKERTVEQLSKRDVHWAKIFSTLWTVLDNEKALWITDLKVLNASQAKNLLRAPGGRVGPGGAAPPYGLTVKVSIFGHDGNRIVALREALRTHEYLSKFLPTINPNPQAVYPFKNGIPVMEFDVTLAGAVPPSPTQALPGSVAAKASPK
jgi:hypothetical protein